MAGAVTVPNTVRCGTVWARFEGPHLPEASVLLSYRPPGYHFSPKYRAGRWDGWIRIMRPDGRFPAGLAPWLLDRLDERGIDAVVIDERGEPPAQDQGITQARLKLSLDRRQEEAVDAAVQSGCGIIHHPTGAGKTVIMSAVIARLAVPALVLVHTTDLLRQTARRLRDDLGIPGCVGVVGGGVWRPAPITVATMQTLYRRLRSDPKRTREWLAQIGQLHSDECHHLSAVTWAKVAAAVPARYRYGYSATPFRSGDTATLLQAQAWIGPVIHTLAPIQAAHAGRIVPADVFMVDLPPPAQEPRSWPEAVQMLIVENETRNDAIASIATAFAAAGPTLVITERLEHGRLLAGKLRCPFVEGATDPAARERLWDDLRQGRRPLLIASRVGDEGLDVPNLRALVLAGGGKAGHVIIQRVGRGRRAAVGKERLFVVDFSDRGRYVGAHANQRARAYYADGACSLSRCAAADILEGGKDG